MKFTDYPTELILKDGIYFSKIKSAISYPESGNGDCFQVEENSFWFQHRNLCILEAFKKYAKIPVFFDIGGGNGYVSKAFEEKNITTILVEPGIKGCLNAQKRGLENIVCSTLQEAHFEYESIPNIGLFDVVEHIEYDVQFLKTIYDYLLPNGLVFITVPAYQTLWSNEDIDAGHFRRYRLSEIEKKLKTIGFEIQYSTYIFSILPLPIFFFRKIPSLFGFNKKSSDLKKVKSEHSLKNSSLDKFSNYFWNMEINKIKKGNKIHFGSSCLIVARKEKKI